MTKYEKAVIRLKNTFVGTQYEEDLNIVFDPPKEQFEYKSISDMSVISANELGREGWRFCSKVKGTMGQTFIFMRRI